MVISNYGNYKLFGDCPPKLMVIFLIHFSSWIFMVFLSYKVLFDDLSHQVPRTTCTSPISFLPSLSFIRHPPPTAFLFFLRILSHGGVSFDYVSLPFPNSPNFLTSSFPLFSVCHLSRLVLLFSQSCFANKVKKKTKTKP